MKKFPWKSVFPLLAKSKGFFLTIIFMLLSACCEKQLIVQDGNEAVSYYVCVQCGRPCNNVICIPLTNDEEIQDG